MITLFLLPTLTERLNYKDSKGLQKNARHNS